MSFISVFDVMGPNMIGPSSSHTAGAARIAYLAQKMINGPLAKVEALSPERITDTVLTAHFLEESWDFPLMICESGIPSRLLQKTD